MSAKSRSIRRTWLLAGSVALLAASCGGSQAPTSPGLAGSLPTTSPSISAGSPATTNGGSSQAPDTGGGGAQGDIPDSAVYLTYHNAAHGFSIQYVEGWQVATTSDGVVIRDKDSSETVTVTALPQDIAAWVRDRDLPALQAQAGFNLVKQDQVTVGSNTLIHLLYHLPAPPDPVTGKQVPSTVDRYYVPGSAGLAVVSFSTPDGVDNVDAFRQMIGSFAWNG